MGVGDQIHTPAALPPGKKAGTHWIWGGVGLTAGPEVSDTTKIAMSPQGREARIVQHVA
jgi:hypothetical protein